MGFFKFFPLIWWLVKEIGCRSYISATVISFPGGSHSIINVFVKSGVVKTWSLHMASLSCWKDWVASGVQENASLFGNYVRGPDILP